MDWKQALAKLPALQGLDSRVDALGLEANRLRSGEPWTQDARSAATRRRRVAELEAESQELDLRGRRLDLDRQSEEAEAKRIEQRLYGGNVRNPRDLEGLQKNLEGSRARISDLETQILEAMEAAEGVEGRLSEQRRQLAAAEEGLTRLRRDGGRRFAAIEAELPALVEQRRQLAAEIDPPLLAEYERVRARADGVGAARLVGGCCEACAVAVSPLVVSRVRRGDRAYTCENCGRILVEG